MPLYPEYREQMQSSLADLKNAGSRKGGSATAAAFLHSFVKSSSWAHLDIAGVAYPSEPKLPHPTHATGFGVRLLVDLLEKMQ
jgi:leucyl aminopeptidase